MLKITVHSYEKRGKRQWCVYRREGGKRRRQWFASQKAAEAEATRLRSDMASTGAAWLALPADQRTALMDLWRKARDKGISLNAALAIAESRPASGGGPALGTVIAELLAAKEAAGRAEKYVTSLRIILQNGFAAGREEEPIGTIPLADIEAWLNSKALASRSTLRSRLSTLFKFAMRRGYLEANPCARLETISRPVVTPPVFTVAQFEKALEWFEGRPRAFAWFVLSTCCGLRPEEAEQIEPEDIHAKEGWVRVTKTKIRQRRVLYPKPEALALLLYARKRGGELPLASQPRRRAVRALRAVLGLGVWPKDITRHSAASYWLASGASSGTVADALGHSEQTLKRHYKALVTAKQAEAFWAVAKAAAKK